MLTKGTIAAIQAKFGSRLAGALRSLKNYIDSLINSHTHDNTYYPLTGGDLQGSITPANDNDENCGAAAKRWAAVYGVDMKGDNYYAADGSQGITQTITIVDAAGSHEMVFKDGLLTGYTLT